MAPAPETPSPSFRVLKAGILSTLQDLGRIGYQRLGVGQCGAMDLYAFRIANRLLGNSPNAACLEITLAGLELKILHDTIIAITGADLSATLDGNPVPQWESLRVRNGSILAFRKRVRGVRSYLSVEGGFTTDWILGSGCTDLRTGWGGLGGRCLQRGDLLHAVGMLGRGPNPYTAPVILSHPHWSLVEASQASTPLPVRDAQGVRGESKNDTHVALFMSPHIVRKVRPEILWEYQDPFVLRVLAGPQSHCFSPEVIETFFQGGYRITPNSDRMGYRLEGPKLQASPQEIISDPIPWGALQVLPNGQLVLLMSDHQTVGGYPKIAVVISADLPKAAQLAVGHRIRFREVTLEEAHHLLRLQEEKISTGIIEG